MLIILTVPQQKNIKTNYVTRMPNVENDISRELHGVYLTEQH